MNNCSIKMATLRYVFISFLIFHCHGQPIFDCPNPVGYGDSSNLTCSNFTEGKRSISTPAGFDVAVCYDFGCLIFVGSNEKMRYVSNVNNMFLLTVHNVDQTDEGEWTCRSGDMRAICSLKLYKLPSCDISCTQSTNNLTIGQDSTLTITLSDYYCTNSIAWNFQIGGKSKNITEFREREETKKIAEKVVTYSPAVMSSLNGLVGLTFNCNDETYDIRCSGVQKLELRGPPSCLLISDEDTGDLTIGKNLTLKAAIEEYPCTSGVDYTLLSGSSMVTEFVKRDRLFYATFEIKKHYLNQPLHLKYTCNNVWATTRTEGVTVLLTKGVPISPYLAIGLPVGIILLAVLFGIPIIYHLKHRNSSSNDSPLYDVPSHDMNSENRYQDLMTTDSRPQNLPDVDCETPQQAPETHAVPKVNDDRTQNLPNAEYEYIDNVEQAPITETQNLASAEYEYIDNVEQTPITETQNVLSAEYDEIDNVEQAPITQQRPCRDDAQYGNIETKSEENESEEYLSAIFERS